ncbi:MAG: transporter associated domain-containing protein [Thiohalophilus sp.]|uniref:HlyC/CorC family transporter n=1 Tax=Thiohalophilus sp. TaxID=3028392 RepID=UPI0028704084|nr:transporter associated domain-containing protein [Thiohalophilus sp.]MDR9435957.1 transporter associated domain-containing protein [Thiohalophilus sp.]
MSEDRSGSPDKDTKPQKSWLERLGQALQGDLKDLDQLQEVLHEAHRNQVIDIDALAMIEGVLQVSDMQVRDIMIPRSQMTVVERDADPKQILKTVIDSAHSRFPAVGESKDDVIGILLAKDLLPYFLEGEQSRLNIRDILRPAVIIPESKRLNVLLKEFRANRNHMAIVVDEYGGVAGLVTIEDVLEQIVGEIEDEHDFEEDTQILQHENQTATVKGITPIEDFNHHFGTDYSDEEFDTIGGLVINQLGHLPKRGEVIELGNLQFRVLRATNRQVHLLEVRQLEAPTQAESVERSSARGG